MRQLVALAARPQPGLGRQRGHGQQRRRATTSRPSPAAARRRLLCRAAARADPEGHVCPLPDPQLLRPGLEAPLFAEQPERRRPDQGGAAALHHLPDAQHQVHVTGQVPVLQGGRVCVFGVCVCEAGWARAGRCGSRLPWCERGLTGK